MRGGGRGKVCVLEKGLSNRCVCRIDPSSRRALDCVLSCSGGGAAQPISPQNTHTPRLRAMRRVGCVVSGNGMVSAKGGSGWGFNVFLEQIACCDCVGRVMSSVTAPRGVRATPSKFHCFSGLRVFAKRNLPVGTKTIGTRCPGLRATKSRLRFDLSTITKMPVRCVSGALVGLLLCVCVSGARPVIQMDMSFVVVLRRRHQKHRSCLVPS
jgi:hypothetical protein